MGRAGASPGSRVRLQKQECFTRKHHHLDYWAEVPGLPGRPLRRRFISARRDSGLAPTRALGRMEREALSLLLWFVLTLTSKSP